MIDIAERARIEIAEEVLGNMKNPVEVRIACTWLILNNGANGKEWYASNYKNYGKVISVVGDLRLYVYREDIEITFGSLDEVKRKRVNRIAFQLNSESKPLLVKLIDNEISEKEFNKRMQEYDKTFVNSARSGIEQLRSFMLGAA